MTAIEMVMGVKDKEGPKEVELALEETKGSQITQSLEDEATCQAKPTSSHLEDIATRNPELKDTLCCPIERQDLQTLKHQQVSVEKLNESALNALSSSEISSPVANEDIIMKIVGDSQEREQDNNQVLTKREEKSVAEVDGINFTRVADREERREIDGADTRQNHGPTSTNNENRKNIDSVAGDDEEAAKPNRKSGELVEQPRVFGGDDTGKRDGLELGESREFGMEQQTGVELGGEIETIGANIDGIDDQQVVGAIVAQQQVDHSTDISADPSEEDRQQSQYHASGCSHTDTSLTSYTTADISSTSISSLTPQSEDDAGQEVDRQPLEHDRDSCSSSNINIDEDLADGDDDDQVGEDFCNESASNQNLRQLRMDASKDVLVCAKNRDSTEAARSLFETLSRQRDHIRQQKQQMAKKSQSSAKQVHQNNTNIDQHNDSFRSHDKPEGGENGDNSDTNNNEEHDFLDRSECQSPTDEEIYDIKIIKRSGSSLSVSGFRRTLVCSVSPTNQMGSNSDMSLQDGQPVYPIDGDEMQQCKVAFRENKRLIERQQKNCNTNAVAPSDCLTSPKPNSPVETSCTWTLRNKGQISLPDCTHCKKKLYPVDKMELDFTRTTLNIHRNCFKCQVCSTMLRLETYSAINAKLYCPAHVKCAGSTR